MRTFGIAAGTLFVLIGVAFGLIGGLVMNAGSADDTSLTCSAQPDDSTVCRYTDYYANPAVVTRYKGNGLGFLVVGAGLFVGGCTLFAGATVANALQTGRRPTDPVPPPAPGSPAGPPPGWPTPTGR